MMFRTASILPLALLLFNCAPRKSSSLSPIRPGVWSAGEAKQLPLPTSGYQVYLVGEMHGLAENEQFQLEYLDQLRDAGVRDVALEEDAVYEPDAQEFVAGRSEKLPEALCLRAGVLEGIRAFNTASPLDPIRVHLVDIDSPASAIRDHLTALKKHVPSAAAIVIPDGPDIKTRGLETVAEFNRLTLDTHTRSELRTIEHSIRVLQDGFEVGIGLAQGNPYLEDREQAIASNIAGLLGPEKATPVAVFYGADHVSRKVRKDGGPNRNQPLRPMALRLAQSGIRTFSIATFPLSGSFFWRGAGNEMPWTASDGKLSSSESFSQVLASVPDARFLYIETKLEHPRLPSQDASNFLVDAFLLFPTGKRMTNRCAP